MSTERRRDHVPTIGGSRSPAAFGYFGFDMDYESHDRRQPAELDLLIAGPQLGVAFFF